jgi:hypothetical protein
VSERIAEFADAQDALRFAKLKGPDYEVCGGINYMYAVIPKRRYATEFRSDQPPESVAMNSHEDDDSMFEEDDE